MLTIKNLKICFDEAIKQNSKFIGVAIETRGNKDIEVIINPRANFENKLEYYLSAYNEDLTLKSYDGIKIVGFTYGDSFNDLQNQLI